jgi:hypothetical protein
LFSVAGFGGCALNQVRRIAQCRDFWFLILHFSHLLSL